MSKDSGHRSSADQHVESKPTHGSGVRDVRGTVDEDACAICGGEVVVVGRGASADTKTEWTRLQCLRCGAQDARDPKPGDV
jgi:hypothetical protein